ncbi:hypothetical protein Cfor_08915 [Coptotermes formosanus]|uniref:Chromo domain-containing protein n=1 Tax=Coptotermes formosanus TaxID=36987 RepID=A0A6L2Q401_COPFO|nr:hypothetical protein Cfor_08915 [Coptotermes formosanus]
MPQFVVQEVWRLRRCKQNYSTEIFRVVKVPRPDYELGDLNGAPIDGQFYAEELTQVLIAKHTEYKIEKILKNRYKCGILEYLVRWKGYSRVRLVGPGFWCTTLTTVAIMHHALQDFYVTLLSTASQSLFPETLTAPLLLN